MSVLLKFFSVSRLSWLLIVAIVLAVGWSASYRDSGNTEALEFASDDELPTVNYAGLHWSYESARVSPADPSGVITIIVDVTVTNHFSDVNLTMPRGAVSIVHSSGQELRLDRFANSDSEKTLSVEAGTSKEITLAFKTPKRVINFDDWTIQFSEGIRRTPALLPLDGSFVSETVPMQTEADTIRAYRDRNIELREVFSTNNYLTNRSVLGSKYVVLDLISDSDPELMGLDETAWSLMTADGEARLVDVRESDVADETRLQVIFEVSDNQDELTLGASPRTGGDLVWQITQTPVE